MKTRYQILLPAILTVGLLVAGCDTKKDATPAASTTTTKTTPAAAATPTTAPTSPGSPAFATADMDKNGSVSFAEAQKIWPNLTKAQFDAADTNKDGSLSAEEYAVVGKTPPAM